MVAQSYSQVWRQVYERSSYFRCWSLPLHLPLNGRILHPATSCAVFQVHQSMIGRFYTRLPGKISGKYTVALVQHNRFKCGFRMRVFWMSLRVYLNSMLKRFLMSRSSIGDCHLFKKKAEVVVSIPLIFASSLLLCFSSSFDKW